MPVKKKKISELEEAQDMKGFYTIGYRIINGAKTSLRFGLEKIQVAYENMVALKDDALAAIRDIRSLESTVESNEEVRETAESRRNASEQARQNEESERIREEKARDAAEDVRISTEEARKAKESIRETKETERITEENTRKASELQRISTEEIRKTEETTRQTKETERIREENMRKASEEQRISNESGRVTEENRRKGEYGGIITELQQAGQTSSGQTALAKQATDEANAAAVLANQKAVLAGEKAAIADAAAGSVNASKDAALQAATGANAAKDASVSQTALAKKATEDANAAKNASVAQTALAKTATDNANAAAQSANNAVAGVDAKVKTAIDALVAGAPGALDTLNELAAAMGNDPNFAATMAAELGKKLNRADIVNNLTSGGTDKPLSAEMGKSLKSSFDSHYHDDRYEKIINKLTAFNKNFGTTSGTVCQGDDSRLSNARPPLAHTHKVSDISDFPSSMPASDVPSWAKQPNKPSYTAGDVGASPSNHNHAGVYQPVGNYSITGHGHTASDVGEEVNKRFMTDGEREKLGGIAENANNYSHPDTHPASVIEESTTRKFMTTEEKNLLSTLGTSAALKDFSNVTTQNLGQNGYCKFPNGLLIQWGARSGTVGFNSMYLPISFYDTNYNIQLTGVLSDKDSVLIYPPSPYVTKTASSFQYATRYYGNGGFNWTEWMFNWFAIGRWK